MVTKFPRRPKPPHLYIVEWREHRGLNQTQLGERVWVETKKGSGEFKLGVDKNSVSRWENEQWRLDPQKIGAIAFALDLEPEELFRPPDRPSVDAILSKSPADVVEEAADIVRRFIRRAS